jgi:hypothetical protein
MTWVSAVLPLPPQHFSRLLGDVVGGEPAATADLIPLDEHLTRGRAQGAQDGGGCEDVPTWTYGLTRMPATAVALLLFLPCATSLQPTAPPSSQSPRRSSWV